MPITILVPLYLVGAMLAGVAGRHTRIGYWGFFFVSLITTPIIPLLFLFFAYPKKRKEYKTTITFTEKK